MISSTHKFGGGGTLVLTNIRDFFKHLWLKWLLALTKIFQYHKKYKNKRQEGELRHGFKPIPVAKGLPLIGTFVELIAAGAAPKLHIYIDKRHRQYGDIFRERLGGTQDAIFVSSANLMRSVFLHEGSHPRHPLPDAWILFNRTHKPQRGLFFMDGEEWFHNRRLLNRILLSGNLHWMDWHVRQCTNDLITKWKDDLVKVKQSSGSECMIIDGLEQQLYRWSIDVVISVMFGSTKERQNTALQLAVTDFAQIVHKIFESSSVLMSFPPKLAKSLRMKIWADFEHSVEQALSKGYKIIDMHLQLSSEYPDGLYGKLKEADTPLDTIKRLFVDLVIAAGDTTAYSTVWSLYLLSQDNELQQKIYEEHHHFPTTSNDMSLVKGLVKETLRLYPVAPFIGRYMPEDAKLDKYLIKKNSLVLLSLYTAGRDPKHFPEPMKVMPERWIRDKDTGEYNGVYKPHASLPFAIGNRSCIGRKMALFQMHYLIAEVTKHFKMCCKNPTPIESVLRLVTVPNQSLILGLSPRIT